MNGQAYAVIDDIAGKAVVYFHASNEADARRFIRANFSKAPRETLEGLLIQILWDWTDPDGFVDRAAVFRVPELVCAVLDWVSVESTVSPAAMRTHEIEEAQRSGAFRK